MYGRAVISLLIMSSAVFMMTDRPSGTRTGTRLPALRAYIAHSTEIYPKAAVIISHIWICFLRHKAY